MKLIIQIFLAVVLGYFVFFGIIGPSLYSKAVESIEKEAQNHLITVRDMKKLELEDYFLERREDLMVMARDPLVLDGLPQFVEEFNNKISGEKEIRQIDEKYRTGLTYYTNTYGYNDLFLVDVEGNVLFAAVNAAHEGVNLMGSDSVDPVMQDIFMQGRSKVAFSDYVWFDIFKGLAAFGASPVRDKRGDVMGVLMFQESFEAINAIMNKRPGLGKTGETYIVGQDKLLRSNSRFVEGETVDQLRVDTVAIKEALNGHSGVRTIYDYRGEEVVSAYAPLGIEGLNWLIIAEMDVAEIFKSVHKMRKLMYLVLGLLFVAIVIYGFIAYRREQGVIEDGEEDLEKETVENVSRPTEKVH